MTLLADCDHNSSLSGPNTVRLMMKRLKSTNLESKELMREEEQTIREIKREMENLEEDADTRLGDHVLSPLSTSASASVLCQRQPSVFFDFGTLSIIA